HCFINDDVVSHAISLLVNVLEHQKARAVVYCFMPDHVHLIVEGREAVSDLWQAVVDFKQLMGFWFSKTLPNVKWQKDFYDHILRRDEDLGTRIRYILDNPVRWGIVKDWRQYPYKGAVGYDLEKVLLQVK
ncbi:MAG: transposase, partial [Candidatus Brocadiales bacterium]|nr:transposase [Candidatus Brocadiales bacterium]